MSISIWWTGKTNPSFLKSGVDEYIKRIRNFDKLEIKEFKEKKGIQLPYLQIAAEEKDISNQLLRNTDRIILLDERGSIYNSLEFANWIDTKRNILGNKLCFIIGGAYGFSDEMRKMSDELLSLSKMTVSHQLIRLLFLEQLYRAYTINNKLPYHHE